MWRAQLGIGQSAPHACAQRQGLWAWWTVDVGGVLGVLRSPLPWRHHVVAVVAGRSWPNPTKLVLHSSAQRWGCSWPTVVVWCVLGVPDGGCGGGSTASWPLVGCDVAVVGNRCRTLVHDTRALGPGRQGKWGVLVVRPTGRRGGGSTVLWRVCGWRSTSHACAQHQGLWARWMVVWGGAIGAVRLSLPQRCRVGVAVGGSQPGCSMRSASCASARREGFPWMQGVSRGGGTCPMNVVGGSAPSHCCAGVGP